MNADHDFGVWLRQARADYDLTQEALAEKIGCSPQTVRSFETGRRRPSRDMAARIADILHVPADARESFIRLARSVGPAGMAASAASSLDAVSAAPLRLSVQLPTASLIGRHADLRSLSQALVAEGRRLVTLLGPGGIGKTRLATQAAADLAGHFSNGAVCVPLAPVTNADDVVTAIAETVGCPLRGSPSPTAALLAFLRDQRLLLVLDNLEHLLGAQQSDQVIELIASILRETSDIQLLITSRERLRLRDEWVIAVAGLGLPSDERVASIDRSESVMLFLARARQAVADFALTPDNRAAVAQICRLLGGAPLGIELAAAWVRVLSCEEIAAEIGRSIDFLVLADRDLPQRHRSLRAVIDHSWLLLAPAEQHLLAGLSVFHGGCRREAINAVLRPPAGLASDTAPALLPLLAALVDKSLVRRSTDAQGVTRYDLHEVVRQYAASRLAEDAGEQAAIQQRYVDYYAEWTVGQEAILKSAEQKQALGTLVIEIDNIRAAWRWGCERADAGLLRRMALVLDWFCEVHGWNSEAAAAFTQGSAALEQAAGRPDATETEQSCFWLLVAREGWHSIRRDPRYAIDRLEAGVAGGRRLNDAVALARCLDGLAYLKIFTGDYAAAQALLEESAALSRRANNLWELSVAMVVRGVLETLRSDAVTARRHLSDALVIARQVGDPRHVSLTLNYFGLAALNLGQLDEAERACSESLTIGAGNRDRFQMSLALQSLGRVALARGDHAECGWLLKEGLEIARAMGDRWLEAQAQGYLGELAETSGDLDLARAQRRAALATAALAPLPIALNELAGLARLELERMPTAALAALAFVRSHPLTQPATAERAERDWSAAEQARPDALPAAIETARAFSPDRPAALLGLFQ
jgi:predicted ATPase/transcriptional regulator with XRE-family HTH domain